MLAPDLKSAVEIHAHENVCRLGIVLLEAEIVDFESIAGIAPIHGGEREFWYAGFSAAAVASPASSAEESSAL